MTQHPRIEEYRRERAIWVRRALTCFAFGLYGCVAGAEPIIMFMPVLVVCVVRLVILGNQE